MTHLEFLRRQRQLSQMDLAIKLRCHYTVISQLERGHRSSITDQQLKALRRIFGSEWDRESLLTPVSDLPPEVCVK